MVHTIPARLTVLTLLLAQTAGGGQPTVEFKFHHLHVRVDDPGLALDEVAVRLGGIKTILQGHGAGVRLGREYVILDRERGDHVELEDRRAHASDVHGAAAYEQARQWLNRRGDIVLPATLDDTAVRPGLPHARVDAIAFAVPDLAAVVLGLKTRGDSPIAESDDGARFRLPSGLVVEVIADTEGPDAFWCPMHPAIRSPREVRCALCGMALVPIPPPRTGEYRMDVSVEPGRNGSGISGIQLVVRDPDSGAPVRDFVQVHDRSLHLFVISRDLERFSHVHPTQAGGGTFVLAEPFDEGTYLIVADFLPAGGTPQMLHRVVSTPGYSGAMFPPPPTLKAGPKEQIVDGGLRIRLDASGLSALDPATLAFKVADAVTGVPVTDLEPYLGASGHLLVVSPDLTAAVHGHPEGPPTSGPDVVFNPILPAPGVYKLWVQVQRAGRVFTVPFVIEAR
jgi:hypothetical protein